MKSGKFREVQQGSSDMERPWRILIHRIGETYSSIGLGGDAMIENDDSGFRFRDRR